MTRWQKIKFFFGFGTWKVVYPEGYTSRPMCARAARSYANIFNGKIEYSGKPIWDLGLK